MFCLSNWFEELHFSLEFFSLITKYLAYYIFNLPCTLILRVHDFFISEKFSFQVLPLTIFYLPYMVHSVMHWTLSFIFQVLKLYFFHIFIHLFIEFYVFSLKYPPIHWILYALFFPIYTTYIVFILNGYVFMVTFTKPCLDSSLCLF